MPGKILRPYTSYEMRGYDVYPSDVHENEYSPPYVDTRSPSPQDPTARYGAFSPGKGRQTPGQSSPYRPSSRINNATQDYNYQTDSRMCYNNDDNNYQYMPQPSPQMRIQRQMTMPARPDQDLDPITRQYYNRLFLRSQSPDINLNRMGRAGGRWRHITSCYANTGSHISFVEGTVKQVDNNLLLPRRQPVQRHSFTNVTANPRPLHRMSSATKLKPKHNSVFHDHAKNGFKYWYQDQNKPMDLAPGVRIAGQSTE